MLRATFALSITIVTVLGIAAVGVVVPLPYPPTARDQTAAVQDALAALLSGATVETPQGRKALPDRQFIMRAKGRVFFRNDTAAPDLIFINAGLRPVPPGTSINVDGGDVLVTASYRDLAGHRTWCMQFSYIFGSLGGHVFQVRTYKCLTRRETVFVHRRIA